MVNVPDGITLGQLCTKAAEALVRAGLDRRIDIYREVEIDDPAIRQMLGRPHRLRVRVRITAASLLFDVNAEKALAGSAEAAEAAEAIDEGTPAVAFGPITLPR